MNKLWARDRDKFNESVATLSKWPGIAGQTELDLSLKQVLQERTSFISHDYKPFLKTYQNIIERLEPSAQDPAKLLLGEQNVKIQEHLESAVITLNMLFALDKTLFIDILDHASNSYIAGLLLLVEESRVEMIFSALSERRKTPVKDEITMIRNLSERKKFKKLESVRKKFVGELLKLRNSGDLEKAINIKNSRHSISSRLGAA